MRKVIIIVVLVVIAAIAGFFLISSITYSEGSRAGYLVKISKKGYIFKTYEGELNIGGMGNNGDGNTILTQNIWEFSVKNEEVFLKLREMEGKHVKLIYKEKMRTFPWLGDTKYFVYEAEAVQK